MEQAAAEEYCRSQHPMAGLFSISNFNEVSDIQTAAGVAPGQQYWTSAFLDAGAFFPARRVINHPGTVPQPPHIVSCRR